MKGSYWRNTSGIVLYIVLKVIYLSFVLCFEETAQARYQFDLELCFSNNFTTLIPRTRQWGRQNMTPTDILSIAVTVFGILGNILVVISILRQKSVLRNNYYFIVLQLAICDLGVLIIYLLDDIFWLWLEEPLFDLNKFYCLGFYVCYIFQVAGIGMMLVISVLRYRATVHPLKPAITRRKLKVVCGLVYVVGLTAGYGAIVPYCFMLGNNVAIFYNKLRIGYAIFCYYSFPTIFMAVVYFKIGRALTKQNKYIKSVCQSNSVKRSAPSSFFNIGRFIRNRKTFLVCLSTVLCYVVGIIPMTVCLIWKIVEDGLMMKYIWISYLADVMRVAGSHSVNPLIYGILDKKLLTFWKLCCKKKKRRSEEN